MQRTNDQVARGGARRRSIGLRRLTWVCWMTAAPFLLWLVAVGSEAPSVFIPSLWVVFANWNAPRLATWVVVVSAVLTATLSAFVLTTVVVLCQRFLRMPRLIWVWSPFVLAYVWLTSFPALALPSVSEMWSKPPLPLAMGFLVAFCAAHFINAWLDSRTSLCVEAPSGDQDWVDDVVRC